MPHKIHLVYFLFKLKRVGMLWLVLLYTIPSQDKQYCSNMLWHVHFSFLLLIRIQTHILYTHDCHQNVTEHSKTSGHHKSAHICTSQEL